MISLLKLLMDSSKNKKTHFFIVSKRNQNKIYKDKKYLLLKLKNIDLTYSKKILWTILQIIYINLITSRESESSTNQPNRATVVQR